MTLAEAQEKKRSNYNAVWGNHIKIDGSEFTACGLVIVKTENGYNLNVHLSPHIPEYTPMLLDEFLQLQKSKNAG
jgi:hypothetical protein